MMLRIILISLAAAGGVPAAHAQVAAVAPPTTSGPSPLGVRQQHVERMMTDVERQLIALKISLQATEPERAERLQQALNRSKELLLARRMAEIGQQLDQAQLDSALAGQQTIITDLRQLVAVLLAEGDVRERARDEFERMGQWKTDIQKFLRAEEELRRAADQATPEALANLAEKQDALAAQTAQFGQKMQQAQSGERQRSQRAEQGVPAAARSMQRAAGALRRKAPDEARLEQDQAINELKQALQGASDQLHERQAVSEAENRADVADRFREMLARQQQLTQQTAAIEKQRGEIGGQLTRALRNSIRAVGERERGLAARPTEAGTSELGLAGMAQQILATIAQSEESLVPSMAVQQLRDELVAVGNLLADQLLTDGLVAAQQQKIERAIETLLAALEKRGDERPSSATSAAAGQRQEGQAEAAPTSQGRAEGQGGQEGGGSRGVDEAAQRRHTAGPESPWSKLRDRQRDPVFSAIQERFPARYQQLLEQYYKSFQDPQGDAR